MDRHGRELGGRTHEQARDAASNESGRVHPARPADDLPGRLRDQLCRHVGRERFERAFGSRVRIAVVDDAIELCAPTSFEVERLRRQESVIHQAFAGADSAPRPVRFRVAGAEPQQTLPSDHEPARRPAARPPRVPTQPPASRHRAAPSRYRLDDFLVGASNRVAAAAARHLAEGTEEAKSFSPLFIHGPCGVGKTHLVQGIASRFAETHPGARVRCVSAEAFTNEYIQAVRTNAVAAFQRRCRRVNLLCIDDIHFFATKEGTQTELLHTLDAVSRAGAAVVLASDAHPRSMKKLQEALVSRFVAGAVVRIDPPEAELRQRLIRRLAERRTLRLTDEAVRLLDTELTRNAPGGAVSVREIEGALTQVQATVRLVPELEGLGGEVSPTAIAQAIAQWSQRPASGSASPRKRVSVDRIVDEVLSTLEVDGDEFRGRGRHRRVVFARAMAALLCRRLTTRSYPEIAMSMGRSTHSTVVTAHQRILKQIEAGGVVDLGCEHDGLTIDELAGIIARRAQSAR